MPQRFFYTYSLSGNTLRFARKLSLVTGAMVIPLTTMKLRSPLNERDYKLVTRTLEHFPDSQHIVFTPSYPRNQGGDLVDATPQPIKEVYSLIQEYGLEHQARTVVFGNRTFGEDFCAAAWESPFDVIARIEAGGTPTDIREVAELIEPSLARS